MVFVVDISLKKKPMLVGTSLAQRDVISVKSLSNGKVAIVLVVRLNYDIMGVGLILRRLEIFLG